MFRRRRARHDEPRQLWENAMRVTAAAAEPSLADGAAPAVAVPGEPEGVELPQDLRVPAAEKLDGTMMRYWAPLPVDGAVIACAACGAYRDWLVLNRGDDVWVRCRDGHEQLVAGLDGAWFSRNSGPIEGVFASREDGLAAFGFDGTFAGTIL